MRKVISFSLYGAEPKYIVGAIKNAKLALELFPGWSTVFYVSDEIPVYFLKELEIYAGEIKIMPEPRNSSGMFWRFIEAGKSTNSHVIFRDTDSRLTYRDVSAVKAWEKSGKALHVIRDHPMHNAPLLGGLWGVVPASLEDFAEKLQDLKPRGYYGEDQEFLWKTVYAPLRKRKYVHDEFFLRELNRNTIESIRVAGEYLGESFDENDEFNTDQRKLLESFQVNRLAMAKLRARSVIMKILGR
jgi:hypothetical protein